jgi:aminopeptidase YwaD
MHIRCIATLLVVFFSCLGAGAQVVCDTGLHTWLKSEICVLTDTSMYGRGYVNDGRQKAAAYIAKKFKDFNVKAADPNGSYMQDYAFSVNTFPGAMDLAINGDTLMPGRDYVIDASSAQFARSNMTVKKVDLSVINDEYDWQKLIASFDLLSTVYILEHYDSACAILNVRKHLFATVLPEGCYIIPQSDKFIWTVSKEAVKATVFYVKPELLKGDNLTVSVNVATTFLPEAPNQNVVGIVPGKVKDSFIAITAHYDHLGMMGSNTMFPGASDNATGTAMLLYLANYYTKNKPKYSVLLIAFSGEEAGLVGSEFYTRFPLRPLENIKFLINLDIMGDATDGITVVNATELPNQFKRLTTINDKYKYLPQVKSRGRASNSDHYHFSEGGVPAFFIYTNGGKGYYHDIYDKASAITLNHVDCVTRLIIDFFKKIGTATL